MTLDVPYTALDLLDRVLDKGIVIDAWVRLSVASIDLLTVEARIVVASIDTYLANAGSLGLTAPMARPVPGPVRWRDRLHEQLRRAGEQLEQRRLGWQECRRKEDRIREEWRDDHARTIAHGKQVVVTHRRLDA
jgi:hypothetical protein